MSEISFTKVKLPYGWLGCMSPHPIMYESDLYRTGEALFQALRFEDLGIRFAIRASKSPMTAKMIAKTNAAKRIIIPRSDMDLDNMRLVLGMKLDQNRELRQLLHETGNATLIEDCSARPSASGLFWGAVRDPGGWNGDNWLGRLWMELRAK